MSDLPDRELTVFSAARRLPVADRGAYLDSACAGDASLRQRVEELLEAAEQAVAFLEDPVAGAEPSSPGAVPSGPGPGKTVRLQFVPSEKPGDRIGRYKLLQQIGEGGCGVVYMAEQEEPVKRRVALKVIKLGMDTRSVIARFEAERQALALMDHPNIAKVFDAGASETGRPYFVMELVRGVKITDYCDQNSLSTQERLGLFMQVCRAIQHAHQKGIIHRDIKPSNILVTMDDSAALPKVIDFGIAKATHGKLTDQTLFTAFEQFIGTPAYMSPEQAELSAQDIDTRSDIYSLGVLLYELLTGQTPFDARKLLQAGLDEIRRTIREEEPARPSTRLSTMLAAELTGVASRRQSAPPRLIQLVRDDLDWIVMKCLEKNRSRRYDTANGLASDIQRHLNNEPVTAAAPSAAYKFQKFVRRHRTGVVTGGLLLLTLLAGIVGTTWGWVAAVRQKRETERQGRISRHTTDFLTGMFESIDPSEAKQREITVREILDQASGKIGTAFPGEPLTELPIRRTMMGIYHKLGKDDTALTNAQALYALAKIGHGDKDDPEVAQSLSDLADALAVQGQVVEALAKAEAAVAMRQRLRRGDNPDSAAALNDLAERLLNMGRGAEALPKFEEALAMRRRLKEGDTTEFADTIYGSALCLNSLGRLAEALPRYQEAAQMCQRIFPGDHQEVAGALLGLANCFDNLGRYSEALPQHQAVVEMNRRIYRGDHPALAQSLYMLGYCLDALGRNDEALPRHKEALGMSQRVYNGDHPTTATYFESLASCLDGMGLPNEALTNHGAALAMAERIYHGDNPSVARYQNNLAICELQLGRVPEASSNYQAVVLMDKRIYKADHPETANALENLAGSLLGLDRQDEAQQNYQDALAMFDRLAAAQPGNNYARVGAARIRKRLGDFYSAVGRPDEAANYYKEALRLAEAILANDNANSLASKTRVLCRIKLGLEKNDVVVRKIVSSSQAEQAGLRPGDVVISYGGKRVDTATDLFYLAGRTTGSGIEVEVRRNGAPLKLTVNGGALGAVCEDQTIAGPASR